MTTGLFEPITWSTSWMDLSSVRWMESRAGRICDLSCILSYWMGDGHHLRRSDRDANLLFGHSGSYNNALHETATYPIDGHRSCLWFSARNPGPDGYATCPASSLSTDCPSYFLCMGSLWHDGNMLHESAVLRVTQEGEEGLYLAQKWSRR